MLNFFLKPLALLGLVLLSPILIISIFLILIEDGFPVFFIQKRLGINKKVFNLYKIRSMHKDAPNLGTHEVSNAHYLKIGSILRSLKIDELPQVVNYLKGDINLIGPRPGLPNQNELTKHRDENNIFAIVPGISGLAQVLGFDMSKPKLLAKVDLLYIRDKSIKLDLLIFVATFFKPFRKKLLDKYQNEIVKFNEE